MIKSLFSKVKGLFVKEEKVEPVTNLKIKGNVNSKGEKIYHLPDGKLYGVVKAEVFFDTEKEAIAAGYRKSKR